MNPEIKSIRFMLAWLVAGITALPAAVVLTITAIASLQTAITELQDASRHEQYWGHFGPVFMAIGWLVLGFCIGTLQKGIIRRDMAVEIRRLGLYSVFGSLLAGFVVILMSDSFASIDCCGKYSLLRTAGFWLLSAAYLGILSSIQTLALRPYIRQTRLWVAAHLGAVALASAIQLAGQLAYPIPYDNVSIHLTLGVPIVALSTGLAMRYLVLRRWRTDKVKRSDARVQPAPAVGGINPSKLSVWDDAV